MEYNGDSTRSFGYGFRYIIENVSGSFVRTTFEYLNLTGIKQYSLNATKPFLTNDVKFGGEIDLANTETVKIWREHEQDTVGHRAEFSRDRLGRGAQRLETRVDLPVL